jgi:hypothetical protein
MKTSPWGAADAQVKATPFIAFADRETATVPPGRLNSEDGNTKNCRIRGPTPRVFRGIQLQASADEITVSRLAPLKHACHQSVTTQVICFVPPLQRLYLG